MSLSFRISLRVERHANGSVTVSPMGFDQAGWAFEPGPLVEDLTLALTDQLERSHPSQLPHAVAPRGRELHTLVIDGLVQHLGEDVYERPGELAVIVEPEATAVRVWIPKLKARLWLEEGQDLQEQVQKLVGRLLPELSHAERALLLPEAGMELEDLVLDVEPAPIERFTGEMYGRMVLPPPEPKPDQGEEEEEEKKKKKPTPTLEKLAFPLEGPEVFGRDEALADLARMLKEPGAVVVVGPPGCGKTAVIQAFANELERPGWYCDAGRLVSIGDQGWRSQVLDAMEELAETEAVWFCGNPLELLDAGKHVGSEMNVAQVLKPWLSSSRLRVVGECSEAGWARLEARDAGFARLFTPYRIREPGIDVVASVLARIAPTLPVPVDRSGVDATLEIAHRYGPVEARLGYAARFLRRLSAEAKARDVAGPLGRTAALDRFCAESGMPPVLVHDDRPLDPDALRGVFASQIIGQDAAVDRLVELVAVIKSGMSDLDRPLGSFLFVGPTGVGKTESAKALARWLFGSTDRLLRFDMSEFSGPDCLVRLLDPDVGLVARVRAQPFCVVLLDEIEKASPAIFDLLLQLLGEARLSDGLGRTADFRNAVVLLTSNLGVGTFRRPTGFGKDLATELRSHVLAEVERFFRPELFNRLDRVVAFETLRPVDIEQIAAREVDAVVRRQGLLARGVRVETHPEVVRWLAERGCDPQYGARPLKRAVAEKLVAPLARHLSDGQPRRVVVRAGKRRLGFDNRDADASSQRDQALRERVVEAGELRFVAEAYRSCRVAREARREVELADRLMQTHRFWRDREVAEARSAAVEPLREVLAEADAVLGEIRAMEELAHERWRHRDTTAVESLVEQANEQQARLEALALGLAGMRVPAQDKVHLRFLFDEDTLGTAQQVWSAYAQLAVNLGWTVHTDGLVWRGEGSADRFLAKTRTLGGKTSRELVFQGPHAGTLLADEAGTHQVKGDSMTTAVRVAVGEPYPETSEGRARRLFDPRRKQLRDLVWRETTTLASASGRSLHAIVRLGLCCRLLGAEQGVRIWKGTRWS